MEKKEITETLVKATSIECFRTSSTGLRRMLQPYWVANNDALVFAFIGNHTELDQLQWQIGEGLVWVREVDSIESIE